MAKVPCEATMLKKMYWLVLLNYGPLESKARNIRPMSMWAAPLIMKAVEVWKKDVSI